MPSRLLPSPVKTALDRLAADLVRPWTVDELASICGVSRRTLQRQFRRFLDQSPMEALQEMRLQSAQRELLRTPTRASVAGVARHCGFDHLGRFAMLYRRRFGESPSATLIRNRHGVADSKSFRPSPGVERPTVAVFPFDMRGGDPSHTSVLANEITASLMRVGWLSIAVASSARYHIRGSIHEDGAFGSRISITLLDAATGRYLWADQWNCISDGIVKIEDLTATRIASAIQTSVREAEVSRALRHGRGRLNVWDLTMRALPYLLSVETAGESRALELLQEAMGRAPQDPLPMALAAWCHGLRGAHNLHSSPALEKAIARRLAERATRLNCQSPLTETILAAAYCVVHEVTTAEAHVDRALAIDGGSAWAWARSAWIKAYLGKATEAIERFQIALLLAPTDPMKSLCFAGVGTAFFSAARYDEAVHWFTRALIENPSAAWVNQHLTPACILAGRKEQAQRSFNELVRSFPALTINQVRAGLPFSSDHLERLSDGLECAGMRVR